jgi:DNA processing protein
MGILIPEAALSSGTLITAQLALEHGRDVFAIPGDIDRTTSEGTNMLISSGQAKCVRCA